jgi:alginate O-acetyltransferase complex protein AlgI
MLFNSNVFIFGFLPAAWLGFWALSRLHRRLVVPWLVLASIVFYSYWKPAFVAVLLVSMGVNYGFSRAIAASPASRRKALLVAAVAVNLGALGYFKYLFPALQFLRSMGLTARDWGSTQLPIGISFFTFTQLAYLVDLCQDEATPEGLTSYAFFVTFFPHLVAGPILHHREIMPQVASGRALRPRSGDVALGMTWFVLGLAKKVVIADHLSFEANNLFDGTGRATPMVAWIGVLAYSLQLYFDFSGYSDMANGLARMFSIEFPFNFNSPYKATNIIDFWQRWHMTLTRYLTLYLYNPLSLAVSRHRVARGLKVNKRAMATVSGFAGMVVLPTMVTMFLAGVWHGAGFQFIVFGLLHGLYLTVNHAWRAFRPAGRARGPVAGAMTHAASLLLTYACVLLGQVFFRASSVRSAVDVLESLAGLHGGVVSGDLRPLVTTVRLALLYAIVWWLPNTQEWLGLQASNAPAIRPSVRWRISPGYALAVGAVFALALVSSNTAATFLYFQF